MRCVETTVSFSCLLNQQKCERAGEDGTGRSAHLQVSFLSPDSRCPRAPATRHWHKLGQLTCANLHRWNVSCFPQNRSVQFPTHTHTHTHREGRRCCVSCFLQRRNTLLVLDTIHTHLRVAVCVAVLLTFVPAV